MEYKHNSKSMLMRRLRFSEPSDKQLKSALSSERRTNMLTGRLADFLSIIALVGLLVIIGSCSSGSNDTTTGGENDKDLPARVIDLTVDSTIAGAVYLSWSATGDDGQVGTAKQYDIRYADDLAVLEGWTTATKVTGAPSPGVPLTKQTHVVTGLTPSNTYFFAIIAEDDAGNISELSNITSSSTTVGCQLGNVTVTQCDSTGLPIYGSNLVGIAGLELHISYDTAVVTFDTLTSKYLAGVQANASLGIINIVWFDLEGSLALSDGDTLCVLHFSDLTGHTDLQFGDNCEIVNPAGNELALDAPDGSLGCTGENY